MIGIVGILCAVPHEAASVLRRMGDVRRVVVGGVLAHEGTLGGQRVLVLAAGMGATSSGPAGALVAAESGLSRLWVVGYGGGLDPALDLGDVVVSPQFPSGFSAPVLRGSRRVVEGKILHVPGVVARAEDKARHFRETGALCCEMESGVIGPIFERHGIPWGGVRAISDSASQQLPVELLEASWDADARRPTPGRLLRRMACRPRGAVEFLRFVLGLGLARENLGRVLERLVAVGTHGQ